MAQYFLTHLLQQGTHEYVQENNISPTCKTYHPVLSGVQRLA